jgi:heme exporter protein A
MIQVSGLAKRFGGKLVLRGLDFAVASGEFVALLGPNGAGKSTLLRIVASLSKPSLGLVAIAGLPLPAQAVEVRARLGFVGHQPLLYADLSAEQNLSLYARLYAIPDPDRRIDELLDLLGLSRYRREPVRVFSRGMQQRLAIGRAILHQPALLLLDEPHTGLDQEAVGVLNDLLRDLSAAGCTILMASHDLAIVTQLAGRFDVLAGGRIAASAAADQISGGRLMRLYAKAVADA